MNNKLSYVYILSNFTKTVFYIGVTSDLQKRMFEHNNKLIEGFSCKYNTIELLYYEIHEDIVCAIQREKKIKKWKKDWKWNLIDFVNKERMNLYNEGEILPINHELIPSVYLQ